MRTMEFKMERENLVEIGQEVSVTEGVLPSSYYYTIEPAVAMSGNYAYYERLQSKTGIVKSIDKTPRGFFVVCEFDEDEPSR
ncbi:MAG: hypothetical protein IIZ41_00375 [Lachnospiraceae bacterium]|jgi:hypothetical protein|nr:hypothetical protein [Lachnospiraceae bacterium]MBQ6637553.1 hypothetical protein [Lachnospiraceae bacterium]MBR3638350.1 hypothetical protein [Lachnospiraceae bacterium]